MAPEGEVVVSRSGELPAVPRLWLMTQDGLDWERVKDVWGQLVSQVPQGTVALSVRCRTRSPRDCVTLCMELSTLAPGFPLVVSRRVDLAYAARVGVHLPSHGLALRDAQALSPPGALVVKAAHNPLELAQCAGGHAALVAPVFVPASHASTRAPLGLFNLAALCESAPVPVLAMGGVTCSQVPALLAAGAHGVAVSTAVWDALAPVRSVVELHAALTQCVMAKE